MVYLMMDFQQKIFGLLQIANKTIGETLFRVALG